MVDVEVPPSFQLRAGEANSIPGWGNGGGWQAQAVGEVKDIKFSNVRPLPK